MSDIAIKVENLGKSYLVGHNAAQAERYTALRDVIARNARNLARKTRDMLQGKAIVQGDEVEEYWALRDVNFEIKQGDRVGIIGRNGAGKSTLLKILSRITEPTTGRISINGRVASLLEVGTGFHPELTGRENIFLNGAILGMSRKEIQRKFDEIVDFAEVEKFLDTPVKRYSSGMYVRLAFAVAAHLEPEILVVDEVLAVGDAQFQEKCLGKMEEVGKEGRTVLFVSHNISAIRRLCSKALLLRNGAADDLGEATEIISQYQNNTNQHYPQSIDWEIESAPGTADLRIISASVRAKSCDSETTLLDENNVFIDFSFFSKCNIKGFALSCIIRSSEGDVVLHAQSNIQDQSTMLKSGISSISMKLPEKLLKQGRYFVSVAAHIPYVKTFFDLKDIISFTIITKNPEILRYPASAWRGLVGPAIATWNSSDEPGH